MRDFKLINLYRTISYFIQGVLPDGQVFDTSMKDSQRPFRFQLGSGNVIKGWERGIQGMCPGYVLMNTEFYLK